VHGIKRRSSSFTTQRVDSIYEDPHVEHQRFILHFDDLTDSSNLTRIVQQVQPKKNKSTRLEAPTLEKMEP